MLTKNQGKIRIQENIIYKYKKKNIKILNINNHHLKILNINNHYIKILNYNTVNPKYKKKIICNKKLILLKKIFVKKLYKKI